MADLHTNIECLKTACQNPRAQLDKYLAAGKKVIGCFEPVSYTHLHIRSARRSCAGSCLDRWSGSGTDRL